MAINDNNDIQKTSQFPTEFKSQPEIDKIFMNNGLNIGRMVAGSKSRYMDKYPKHKVVFNANVISVSRGKIWFGDLDLTTDDSEKLYNISKEIGETLYVLREMDCRFGTENNPIDGLLKVSVWSTAQFNR